MLCTDVLENFLLNQKLINNSNETILYYKQRIGYFISFVGNIEVENLSISHYNSYVLYLQNKVTEKKQKLSSYTIKTSLNAVKIFINYCYKQGFNNCNFVINIKPYKVNKNTIVVLTPSEINLLLSSQNEYTCLGLRNLLRFYNFSWGNKSPNYFLYKNSIYPSSLIKLFYYKKQTKEIKINAK